MNLNDYEFLEDFAFIYNNYKKQNLLPKDIKIKMMKNVNCSESKYYKILRKCRELDFIKDSYYENRNNMIKRIKKNQNDEHIVNTNTEEKKDNILIKIINFICKKLRIYG